MRDLASSLREARRAEGTGATTGSSGGSIASAQGQKRTRHSRAPSLRARRYGEERQDWSSGLANVHYEARAVRGRKDQKEHWIRLTFENHPSAESVAPVGPMAWVSHQPAVVGSEAQTEVPYLHTPRPAISP